MRIAWLCGLTIFVIAAGVRKVKHRNSIEHTAELENSLAHGGQGVDGAAVASSRRRGCVNLLLVGDTGFGTTAQKTVAKGMAKVASTTTFKGILHLGDIIYPSGAKGSSSPMNQKWRDIYMRHQSLNMPWWMLAGNHDWYSDARRMLDNKYSHKHWKWPAFWYKKRFTSNKATVDVFFIDTMVQKESEAKKYIGNKKKTQQDWLKQKLKNSDADWKVVAGHHPLRAGSERGMGSTLMKPLEQIMREGKASLWLSGHRHHQAIMAANGITFVIAGSGGSSGSAGSKGYPNKGGLKGNWKGGGFMTAHFCGKSAAHLEVFDRGGSRFFKYPVGNLRSSGLSSAAEPETEPDNEPEAHTEAGPANDEIRRMGSFPTAEDVQCEGVTLTETNGRCSTRGCTVSVDRPSDQTCAMYCADHGLACVAAWAQDDEEDCTPSHPMNCLDVSDTMNNNICQCGALST